MRTCSHLNVVHVRAEGDDALLVGVGGLWCDEPAEGVVGIPAVGDETQDARDGQRPEEREEQDEGHGSNSPAGDMLPRLT